MYGLEADAWQEAIARVERSRERVERRGLRSRDRDHSQIAVVVQVAAR